MKKKGFLWMAMLMVAMVCAGFASCSSDDDDEEIITPTESALSGTWQLTQQKLEYDDGEVSYKSETDEPEYWHFDKEGSGLIIEDDEDEWYSSSFSYTLTDDILKMSGGYRSNTYKVLKLTKSEMQLWFDDYDLEVTMTFKKVSDSVLNNVK